MDRLSDLIIQLADRLGVATTQLIEMYAKRWWVPWVDAGLCAIGAVIALLLVRYGASRVRKTNFDDDPSGAFICAFCGIGAAVLVIAMFASIHDAVSAMASPQAWAVDQILETLRGH